MRKRAIGLVLALTLSVPVSAIVSSLPPFVARPAGATGFNFLCSPPGSGGSGGSSEFALLANGLAESILNNSALWFFTGTVPAGVPVIAPATTDPVTGQTTFTRPIQPRLGQNQGMDFLDGSVVPGAAGNDFTIGLQFRSKAGQRSGPSQMLALLEQNFGLPPDSGGNDIGVTGIDLDFSTDTAVSHMHGFKGLLQAAYSYKLNDGTTNIAIASFRFDASGAGALMPDSGSLDFAFRRPTDSSSTHWVFEQDSIRNDFNGTTNQAGVGYGFGLDRLVNNVRDPLLSADISWSAAPRSVAIGLGDLCPDESHFAWNMIGLPQPSVATVGMNVTSGIGEGRQIEVNGPTGPVTTQADAFGLQGSITKLPQLIDVILRRDEASFTRSNDVAPDIDLTRLAMADNDPAHPTNLPLFATAHLSGMPRHILLTAAEDSTTGAFTKAELTSWVLSCPGESPPPGPAAPDGVRRLDLPLTLPGFPVGCVRWSLTPIPSAQIVVQNWLPEDLRGVAAAAGLATAPLAANQFAFYATRTHNTLSSEALLAFGAKINGLQRATVDLTAPPAGGTGVRLYIERAPVAAADDSAQVVGDVDLRTSTNEALNTGIHVSSSATVTDLPDTIRLDYSDTPAVPFRFTWRADAGIALTHGVFDVLLPTPTALTVHGAFETGAVGAGGLPPAGDLIFAVSADQTSHAFLWIKPATPSDTFPTPTVPAFDPNTITHLHAGAEISTLAQRTAGLAIRAHADIDVPQPVTVSWVTAPDGAINSATAAFCAPSQPAACAATKLDATAAMGPRTDISPAALLSPPELPGPDGTIENTVPTFTDYRPGSGARAVVFSATSWGVDLLVRGIARVSYNRSPENYEVQLANAAPQPFRVNLLDASTIIHGSNGFDRPQVLFADAAIDALPQQMRVQLDDSLTDGQPMLWVNTENLAITTFSDSLFNVTDPPGARPVITGIVRAGDAQILSLGVPAASRPTPPRTAAHKGIDLFGDFDVDRGFFGIDASVALDVPRELALFRPTSTDCSEATSPPVAVDACQTKRSYEIDRVRTMGFKLETTSESLGDLDFNGSLGGTNLNLGVHGEIGNIPGRFDGSLTMAQNARMPWTTFDTSFEGSTPLQSVLVEVVDRTFDADSNTPGNQQVRYESNGVSQPTSNYAVSLTNVPANLDVNSRVLGVENRLSDAPIQPFDPCSANSPSPGVGIGYVHGSFDLANAAPSGAAVLNFFVRDVDGQEQAKMTSTNGPVSGFVNARADHVIIKVDSNCGATTDDRIKAGALGAFITGIGAVVGGVAFGPIGAGIGAVIGAIIAFILDLFSNPTVTLNMDIDVDLPFYVDFNNVSELHLGLNSATISVGSIQPNGGDPLNVGFRQRSLPSETPFSADGGWYWHRHVSFVGDDIPLDDDWNIGNDITTPTLATVGMYTYDECKNGDSDHPCYESGVDNVATVDTSGDFVMDPFFTAPNRTDLHDNEGGTESPGSDLFQRLANQGSPVTVESGAFDFPDFVNTTTAPATFGFETNCCADAQVMVNGFGLVDLGRQGAVCEYPEPSSTTSVGSDGTEYTVAAGGIAAVTNDQHRSLCAGTSYVLQARLPAAADGDGRAGPVRWSIVLPTPAGLESGGACQQDSVRCELSYTVNPQADGSVQVTETTSVITNGVDEDSVTYVIVDNNLNNLGSDLFSQCCPTPSTQTGDTPTDGGSTHALVDASGQPGFWQPGDAAVDTFDATTNGVAPVVGSPGKFTLDPCAIASFACGQLGDGERLVWLFGDGSTTTVAGLPAVQTHVYPGFSTPQSYLGELVLLGPNCSQDTSRVCNVEDKEYFTVSN
jgi:hypothetical protein